MKLYFYFLEGRKNGCIQMEECDVMEKRKTYYPVNIFPDGFYREYVRKDEIGKFILSINKSAVILTEKDSKKVAELFSARCNFIISKAKDRIRYAEYEIDEANGILDAIKEWQHDNM